MPRLRNGKGKWGLGIDGSGCILGCFSFEYIARVFLRILVSFVSWFLEYGTTNFMYKTHTNGHKLYIIFARIFTHVHGYPSFSLSSPPSSLYTPPLPPSPPFPSSPPFPPSPPLPPLTLISCWTKRVVATNITDTTPTTIQKTSFPSAISLANESFWNVTWPLLPQADTDV